MTCHFTSLRTIAQAKADHPSLIDVVEVDDERFRDTSWIRQKYQGLTPINTTIAEENEGYGEHNRMALLKAKAVFYNNADGELKSLILLPKRLYGSFDEDTNFGLKLACLYHEIGHVLDAEQGLNIRQDGSVANIVAAEVFANCYALERLAARHMALIYRLYYDIVESNDADKPYLQQIKDEIFRQHPRREIPSWHEILKKASPVDVMPQ